MKRCLVFMMCLAISFVALPGAAQQAPTPAQTQGAQPQAAQPQAAQPQAAQSQAQTAPTPTSNLKERAPGPTETDLNCAGFITNQNYGSAARLTGGWESPNTSRFADRDFVYITGNAQPGQEFSVIRKLRDPNHSEAFPGQRRTVAAHGGAYAELGRVRVTGHSDKVAIAEVVSSCDYMVEGDYVVPVIEHQALQFRPEGAFERFAPPNGKATGRIIMAKDFDFFVAAGQKVYLDMGADKGLKPGDYVRAVRTAEDVRRTPIDALSRKASINEDTQANHAFSTEADAADFPRKAVGEMMVLSVSPSSATAMVLHSLDDIHVGDTVEVFDPPPPPPAPPAAAMAAPRAPTLSCAAQPMTVRAGDTATVTCQAESPDGVPVRVSFAADRGRMRPRGMNATQIDTTNISPGPINVTATAADDRGMTTTAQAMLTVEAAPPPPTAARTDEIAFKPNSSYVDNRAKAVLDGVALRLQNDPTTRVVVKGNAKASDERTATARSNNVRTYLSRDKGIDAGRIQTRTGSNGDTADIFIVPPGAQPPQ
jgi:outer membrane protein OmpA-like peptidoglycan-associated protein